MESHTWLPPCLIAEGGMRVFISNFFQRRMQFHHASAQRVDPRAFIKFISHGFSQHEYKRTSNLLIFNKKSWNHSTWKAWKDHSQLTSQALSTWCCHGLSLHDVHYDYPHKWTSYDSCPYNFINIIWIRTHNQQEGKSQLRLVSNKSQLLQYLTCHREKTH